MEMEGVKYLKSCINIIIQTLKKNFIEKYKHFYITAAGKN